MLHIPDANNLVVDNGQLIRVLECEKLDTCMEDTLTASVPPVIKHGEDVRKKTRWLKSIA